MHVYDTSSLQVLRHAQANSESIYGQVVLDEAAMAERRFAVLQVGSRLKVLSLKPSTHSDKFGGESVSMMIDVIGVGLFEPGEIVQKMPFMSIECDDADDGLLMSPSAADPKVVAEREAAYAAIEEAAVLCQSLDEVASFKGPLTQASERQAAASEDAAWSLSDCVGRVVALRAVPGQEPPPEASWVTLAALATTVHLPGKLRFEAMRLAQQEAHGGSQSVLDFVSSALQEEAKRRLALKAIGGVSNQ